MCVYHYHLYICICRWKWHANGHNNIYSYEGALFTNNSIINTTPGNYKYMSDSGTTYMGSIDTKSIYFS